MKLTIDLDLISSLTILLLLISQIGAAATDEPAERAAKLKKTAMIAGATGDIEGAANAFRDAATNYEQAGMIDDAHKMYQLSIKECQSLTNAAIYKGDYYRGAVWADRAASNYDALGNSDSAEELRTTASRYVALSVPPENTPAQLLQAARIWTERAMKHQNELSRRFAASCFEIAAECYFRLNSNQMSKFMYILAAKEYEKLVILHRNNQDYQLMSIDLKSAAGCYFNAGDELKGLELCALAVEYSSDTDDEESGSDQSTSESWH